jgi:hypothetical protein
MHAALFVFFEDRAPAVPAGTGEVVLPGTPVASLHKSHRSQLTCIVLPPCFAQTPSSNIMAAMAIALLVLAALVTVSEGHAGSGTSPTKRGPLVEPLLLHHEAHCLRVLPPGCWADLLRLGCCIAAVHRSLKRA